MPKPTAPRRHAKATKRPMANKATKATRAKQPAKVTYNTVRKIGLALPGVADGVSYGTPSLNVQGKFMLRLREDDVLAIRCDFFERDHRMKTDPDTFFIIEHYRDYPAVLIRLSKVRVEDLRDLIEQAWRRTAPKKLLAQHSRPS